MFFKSESIKENELFGFHKSLWKITIRFFMNMIVILNKTVMKVKVITHFLGQIYLEREAKYSNLMFLFCSPQALTISGQVTLNKTTRLC